MTLLTKMKKQRYLGRGALTPDGPDEGEVIEHPILGRTTTRTEEPKPIEERAENEIEIGRSLLRALLKRYIVTCNQKELRAMEGNIYNLLSLLNKYKREQREQLENTIEFIGKDIDELWEKLKFLRTEFIDKTADCSKEEAIDLAMYETVMLMLKWHEQEE
jgi:hypothetical protein